MARPRLNTPKKQSINLTVSEEAKQQLRLLSEYHGMSVSALLEKWAAEEMKRAGLSLKEDGS